jgi:NAD(P)H dehydrogenase (quinone)
MASIAVVGATGNTGRATIKELKALGENPLCVIRNAEKAREVLGADATTAIADIEDRASLEKALKDIERVFIVTGHNPRLGDQQVNILEAAKAAGAEFILKVSGGRSVVGPNVESIVGRGHHMVEESIRNSGLSCCLLSPGLFMQNTLAAAASIKNDGKIVQPFASNLPLSFVDVRDTAAIAARILLHSAEHAGKVYEFSGAETNFEEFAKVFSDVLGKPIVYVGIGIEAAEQGMKARGMPEWLVAHLLAMARIGATGGFSAEKTRPIRDIVGRAPLTTRQFVEDHKLAFS